MVKHFSHRDHTMRQLAATTRDLHTSRIQHSRGSKTWVMRCGHSSHPYKHRPRAGDMTW